MTGKYIINYVVHCSKCYTQYPIQGISQNASGFRPYVVIPCIGYNPYEVTYLIRLQGLFLVSGFLVLDTYLIELFWEAELNPNS